MATSMPRCRTLSPAICRRHSERWARRMPDTGMPETPVLRVEDLTVRFRRRGTDVAAVNGASFALRAGETLTILGESGSGKSVSLKALMGLLPAYAQVSGKV